MYKNLVTWFFFTLIAGALPLGLNFIFCIFTVTPFTYFDLCPEVIFFNLLLSADGLKDLYEIDNNKKSKVFLNAALIFILIISAIIYGFLLAIDHQKMDLNMEAIIKCSIIITITCVIISLNIQLLRGENNDH